MPIDGFTKALGGHKYEAFVRLVDLRDIKEQLEIEERLKALRDKIKAARLAADGMHEVYFVSRASDLKG